LNGRYSGGRWASSPGEARTGLTAAVRIRVPVLDHTAAFPPQEPLVIQALGAVRRLWQWAAEHSGRVRWR
jgi:hypothetical protein